jgi:hypothetical protein
MERLRGARWRSGRVRGFMDYDAEGERREEIEVIEAETSTATGMPLQIPRLVIPWEENWKDGYGMNELIVNGVFDRRSMSSWRVFTEC